MTTLQEQPFREAVMISHDDAMEVSEELERQNPPDEDIEIDFDTVENHHEDENMLESGYFDEEQHMQEEQQVQPDKDDEMADEEDGVDLGEEVFDEDIVDATGEDYNDDQGQETLSDDHAIVDASATLEIPGGLSTSNPVGVSVEYLPAVDHWSLETSTGKTLTTDGLELYETNDVADTTELHLTAQEIEAADRRIQDRTGLGHSFEGQVYESWQPDQDELEEQDDEKPRDVEESDEHIAVPESATEYDEQITSVHPHGSNDLPQATVLESTSSQENSPDHHNKVEPTSSSSNSINHDTRSTSETVQDTRQALPQVSQLDPSARVNDQTRHVHPILVHYQNDDIYLFPPRLSDQQSETYFLEDENLVHENLRVILEACRSVLADSIIDREELGMSIESLSLNISETAKAATTTSLSQLIDLYLQLHRNDGVQDPEPLRLILTTKPKFASQLDFLYSVVNEGKGFLDLSETDHSNSEVLPATIDFTAETGDLLTTKVKGGVLDDYTEGSNLHVQEHSVEQIHDAAQTPSLVLVEHEHEHDDLILDFGSPDRKRREVLTKSPVVGALDSDIYRTDQSDVEEDYANENAISQAENYSEPSANGQLASKRSNYDTGNATGLDLNSDPSVLSTAHHESEATEKLQPERNASDDISALRDKEAEETADRNSTPKQNANQYSPEYHPNEDILSHGLDFINDDVFNFEEENLPTTDAVTTLNEAGNDATDVQNVHVERGVKQTYQDVVKDRTNEVVHETESAIESYTNDEITYDDEDEREGEPELGNSHSLGSGDALGQSSTGEPRLSTGALKRPRSTEDETTNIIDYEPHEDKKARPV